MVIAFAKYFLLLTSVQFHAYYVSVCEIYHNPKANSLEISMKIFVDDLELAIQKSGRNEFVILDNSNKEEVENEIENYLAERLIIEIDSKITDKELIGYELDNDVLMCYVEIKKVKDFNKIKIRNSIITEVYSEQINLTHLQFKERLKSLKTTKSEPEGFIDVSTW
jgi:hypothetical protein